MKYNITFVNRSEKFTRNFKTKNYKHNDIVSIKYCVYMYILVMEYMYINI